MNAESIIGFLIILTFYGCYFAKMLGQRKKGIQTDRMGKGSKPKKTYALEVILKFVTFTTAAIQLLSVIFVRNLPILMSYHFIRVVGLAVAFLGIVIFMIAMITMRDSWRAGIDHTQKTKMICTGIYRFSRNPAFLGFDLFYLGMALAFSNVFHLIFAFCSILILHLQILEEEKYLPTVFGEEYLGYKKKTLRYFGKR